MKPKRALKPDERAFVTNEALLSVCDYRYWASRYCWFIADPAAGGGLQRLHFWASQEIILSHMAKLEENADDAMKRGEPTDGILIAVHKARQLGATMLVRSLHVHRITTCSHIRALAGSIDDEKVQKLYERDKRIIDNLPWWLAPSRHSEDMYDEKASHIVFRKLDSSMLYQELVQRTGIGQGEQFDLGHLTEVASVAIGTALQHDFFPTIPQAARVFHVLETTAQGRDNWWRFFIDELRRGGTRWHFVFVPWYVEPVKYRRQPPVDWKPTEASLLYAQKVFDTSEEYCGKALMLSKQQLYWYESTRAEYQRNNSLNLFLTNFCSTVEESFQHTTESIIAPDVLEDLRMGVRDGLTYEIAKTEA